MTGPSRIDLGGGVLLDPANESLLVEGAAVPLRPKVYGVLSYLVQHPHRIVTKDELLDEVWRGTVVSDSVLKVCVRELRTALGDSTKEPRYVATVHRRGYRYVGGTEPVGGAPAGAPTRPPKDDPPPPTAEASAPADPHFVAREREVLHLERAVREARAGQRRTVFVSGPAGIGKTALVDGALGRIGADAATRVVHGRCQDTAGPKEPYLPFLECVRELASSERGAEVLRRVAPTWFVQYPWLLREDDRPSLERELQGATETRMARELDAFLSEFMGEATLVLLLEDLHWSDASSIGLLSFLATRDSPARLLIVATTRSIELIVDDHPLRSVKRELTMRPGCSELPLELMAAEEVHALASRRLGGAEVDPAASRWLHARTEGHPLFAVHLLDDLVSSGHLAETDGVWTLTAGPEALADALPESLPAIVARTLERCSPDERLALQAGALAGLRFSAQAVAHATELDVERVEELCDGLAGRRDFVEADGIVELPGPVASPRFRFTHALLRESLGRSISPASRVRLQRRLAERGEELYGSRAPEIASHLAVHFEEAWLHERAVHYRRIAADQAARRYSNGAAVEHLRAAHQLLLGAGDDARELTRVVERDLARALRAAGDVLAAAEVDEALAAAASTPEEAAEHWLLAAGARSWHGREGCMDDVERALALAPRIDDEAALAHVHGCAAYWQLLWEGWRPEGRAASERALELAEEHGHLERVAAHRARLAFFLTLEGQHEAAEAAAQRAGEEALALGDGSEGLLAHFYRGVALHLGGRMEGAREHLDRARDEARRNGHQPWSVLFEIQLAWIAVEEGRSGARALAEAALDAARPLDHAFIAGLARSVAALAAAAEGDVDAARALIADVEAGAYLMDWLCRLVALMARARLGEEAAGAELSKVARRMGNPALTRSASPPRS